jgi:hypothetical protein
MTIFYTKGADHVQWDLIDGTFDLPILAQLRAYLEDYAWIFPDERLYRRFVEAIKGLIAARVPIVAQMAAAVIQSHDPRRTFHVAKRYYRWLDNPRLDQRSLLKPAYAQTRQWFADQSDEYLLVILDFSNLEKPYGYKFELLCTLKASGLRVGPRCRRGKVPGYNQLLALAVTQKKVGLTFAKTISYKTEDFVSLNRDIFRAIRYSRVILKGHRDRFVCDRGFDDEKTFAFVVNLDEEFIIRLYHNRLLQLQRGRAFTERLLEEVVQETRRPIRFQAWFKVRGRWRKCPVTLGYRKLWLPGHSQPYWLVVSNVYGIGQQWILLTNVPIQNAEQAKEIWFNYRRRWCVEDTFRFLQKEGLRWEDFKVLGWEAIRRLVNLVLIAALFLLNIKYVLDETSLQLLLTLGGKLGLKSERDGPYLLLRGFQKLLACVNTLAVLKRYGQLDALLKLLDAL